MTGLREIKGYGQARREGAEGVTVREHMGPGVQNCQV